MRGSARIYDVRMAQFVLKIEKLSHIMGPRASQDLRSPSPIMAPGLIQSDFSAAVGAIKYFAFSGFAAASGKLKNGHFSNRCKIFHSYRPQTNFGVGGNQLGFVLLLLLLLLLLSFDDQF